MKYKIKEIRFRDFEGNVIVQKFVDTEFGKVLLFLNEDANEPKDIIDEKDIGEIDVDFDRRASVSF